VYPGQEREGQESKALHSAREFIRPAGRANGQSE
jgi:hypothetical protein